MCSITWYDISDAFHFIPHVHYSAQCMTLTTMWNLMVSISPWPRELPSHYRWDITSVVTTVDDSVSVYPWSSIQKGLPFTVCLGPLLFPTGFKKKDWCAWNKNLDDSGQCYSARCPIPPCGILEPTMWWDIYLTDCLERQRQNMSIYSIEDVSSG